MTWVEFEPAFRDEGDCLLEYSTVWCFRGAYCLHHQEAFKSAETTVNIYQTTRYYISEGSHLRTRLRENLKSHIVFTLPKNIITEES
jgi:hypothetical protein